MCSMLLHISFVLVLISSVNATVNDSINSHETPTDCSENGDCATEPYCQSKCGCERSVHIEYIYNETTGECVINMKQLMLLMVEKYHTQENITAEAERLFKGVIIAAILFAVCAFVGIIAACLYCFRINYTDYRLTKEVKQLARHMGKNPNLRRPRRQPLQQIQESCNVVCEGAGIMVI